MRIRFLVLLTLLIVIIPVVVLAQATYAGPMPTMFDVDAAPAKKDLGWLAGVIADVFSLATGMIFTAAFTAYIFGMVMNFNKLGQGEADDMKKFYVWGLLAIFLGASVWGMVYIIQNTFLPGSSMLTDGNRIDIVPKCAYSGGNCQ